MLRQLQAAAAFAPLHAPAALALIRFAHVHFPGVEEQLGLLQESPIAGGEQSLQLLPRHG